MTAPTSVERVYTPRILAVFGATMLYFGVAGVAFPVLPRLVERELGGCSAEIGLVFGVWAIGMLVVRPFGGYMLDRIGRRPVMIGGALALVVAQLLHTPAAGTGELWVLLVVRVFSGAASSVMYLSQATVATELPPAEHRDRVFGLFSTVVLVGFAVGQVFGEIVMQAHGLAWACALAAASSIDRPSNARSMSYEARSSSCGLGLDAVLCWGPAGGLGTETAAATARLCRRAHGTWR